MENGTPERRSSREDVVGWLLDSDPAIRWQVMRDLTDEPEESVARERSRVAREGWGANLLALQNPDGSWGPDTAYRNWEPTLYTLLLLKELGVDPDDEKVREMVRLVRDEFTWGPEFGDHPFFEGEEEPCINGGALALGGYFGESSDRLVELLLGEQLEDGGWNCDAPRSCKSSFHTTICVLEGLLAYENDRGATPAVTEARLRGHEYLLDRGMFRSLSSGEVVDSAWLHFSFPTNWHYDVLRGLDLLRRARAEPDDRISEAVGIVRSRQDRNGRWPLENPLPNHTGLDMEGAVGEPSRWNTLRALRVLDWASPNG